MYYKIRTFEILALISFKISRKTYVKINIKTYIGYYI